MLFGSAPDNRRLSIRASNTDRIAVDCLLRPSSSPVKSTHLPKGYLLSHTQHPKIQSSNLIIHITAQLRDQTSPTALKTGFLLAYCYIVQTCVLTSDCEWPRCGQASFRCSEHNQGGSGTDQ
ncbi:hypothetical protein PHET_00029 [Paragonimus heterotremus]|uniref:Uncharacterized protein n=1 Tax=Paragonimus heterotremus TaxID=100268 RepID=A0A8J4T5F8_9TREM|nr:hypothetical protein PHET_00029 [Paragonimus heterotremus]